jgi:hypothetical protein
MLSFPAPLSTDNETTLRASGYWARVMACLCPLEVVFRAQAAVSITGQPFIQFTYDTVDVGAFGDVWEGMVAYISATDSIREAKYRGRVRLAPDSNTFFIDYNVTILNDNDKIIVVRDTDLFTRQRDDTLIDSAIPFHDLPPMLAGLPTAIVLYDSDNDGVVTYTPSVEGIPVDAAATVVDTWAWSISGAGSSSIDNAALQAPLLTFQAGYHYLLRVIYEDDNGQENYQISHVYAVTRTFSAPTVTSVLVGSISHDIDDGSTVDLTAYADVSTLIDRTHVAIFALEHFGDGESAPLVNNVWMSGRIRSSSIQTEGSAEAGRAQQVTFSVEGITSYLRRLNIPNDIVRTTDTPDEWGEGIWNPYRMAVYAMWAYTTLTNICSFSVEDGAFEAYEVGGEPRGIDGGKILDVLTGILDPIKAAPNFAPSGEIHLARTVAYREDRSGVDTVATFELQDTRDLDIDEDSSRTTSQVVAYGGVFDSAANVWVLYQAHAPTVVYGEGDTRELTREILVADSTIAEAQDELEARASNDYAFNNAKPLMRLSLFDSYAGVLVPSNFQRWVAIVPASANPLGKAYGATDYWQLQSVTLGINADGTVDTSGEWYAETVFSDAQTDADLLPDNLSDMNPVLPVLPNEPALPTDPLENYPTDAPTLDELQPIDPSSAGQAYTPFPPDVAADMANKQGLANCRVLQPLFSNSSNTESSWLTVNTQPYRITLTGSAGIETEDTFCADEDNFSVGTIIDHTGNVYTVQAVFTGSVYRIIWGTNVDGAPCCNLQSYLETVGVITSTTVIDCEGNVIQIFSDLPADVRYFLLDSAGPFTVELTMAGGGEYVRFADAFYSYEINEDGEEVNEQALGPSEGLFIDNSLYVPSGGVPPFDSSHRYANLAFTGTGNIFRARMVFSSYIGVQTLYLTIDVCRQV